VDLAEVMVTTGTCREFTRDPVPDEVLLEAMEVARFAPQGGNRQGVRLLVVRDPATRRTLRDLYLTRWRPYLAARTGDRELSERQQAGMARTNEFAERLDEVPALVVVCCRLSALHPTDHELGRLSVVGGASIYPLMQNFCLALRNLGVASAVTTMLCHDEPAVRTLLGIPDDVITAAHLAVGYPARPFPTTLSRVPAAELLYGETWGTALTR
jgi:nitroreductase